jgi:NADPH-dependent 2,4-dienoyl-CoA reductase/sulfur reductase-like enzyme
MAYQSPYSQFDIRHRILIVGTGPAGLNAAQELRKLGFEGELIVMGDEPEGPYDRPACSKGLLTGHKRPEDVLVHVDPHFNITWKLGRRAVHCDLNWRYVEAHTGERIHFDGLVIATGCRPVVPVDWPDDEPGMHVIHGLPAAWKLRTEMRHARKVAVVGGGVTGCEVACAVRDMAREAVIVEPRPFLMGRAVGSVVGHMIAASHRMSGIELRSTGRVANVDRFRGRWRLTLKDSSTVEADIVVAAMGERPDVEWLAETGIDITDGVLCDGALRALMVDGTVAEGVVACGSLARWPNPRTGNTAKRVGQWIAAQEIGQAAARALLAGGRPMPTVSILPRYWSHQLGLRIEVCGDLDANAEIQVAEMRPGRRDAAKAGVVTTYTRRGRLVGAVAVNSPRAFTTMARMMLLDEPTVLPPLGPGDVPVSPAVAVGGGYPEPYYESARYSSPPAQYQGEQYRYPSSPAPYQSREQYPSSPAPYQGAPYQGGGQYPPAQYRDYPPPGPYPPEQYYDPYYDDGRRGYLAAAR